MTYFSRNEFWSSINGVHPKELVWQLNILLRSMIPRSLEDEMEKVKLGSTNQSSMEVNGNYSDQNNSQHISNEESGFVVTKNESNPYWEVNFPNKQECVLQVDVYDAPPDDTIILSLLTRKKEKRKINHPRKTSSTKPLAQGLGDEKYDRHASGQILKTLLPDECQEFRGNNAGASENGMAKHRVCRYYVKQHFKGKNVEAIRLSIEGFGQLRLGRVDVWVRSKEKTALDKWHGYKENSRSHTTKTTGFHRLVVC